VGIFSKQLETFSWLPKFIVTYYMVYW